MTTSTAMTAAAMAERLARTSGKEASLHARQIRHWTAKGVLDEVDWIPPSETQTSAKLYSERHLAAAAILHVLAAGGLSYSQLRKAARILKNRSVPVQDERVWRLEGSAYVAHGDSPGDGLSTAIHFAKQYVASAGPDDSGEQGDAKWRLYLTLQLDRNGDLQGGSVAVDVMLSDFDYLWIEKRVIHVTPLLAGLFSPEAAATAGGE